MLAAGLALPFAGVAHAQLTCGELTAPQTEGPFFKPKSPERRSFIESGSHGEKLILTGVVFSRACKPVANALLDFWHSDDMGEYDNQGFSYRGHQFADPDGRFRLETIVPARYPGRTRHIHVKVQAPGRRVLTTQVYFPGDPGNRRDPLFRDGLALRKTGGEGRFDFVIEA
ncbi:MAG TPA: intradiol ring-cleavage dioxygenase [Burkholderiales bacterium]|nr:intradiol ring-cleavage dioxygenase [Burkholderiales bacterium]